MNVFEWTLPFLFEKVMRIWSYMLTRCTERNGVKEVDVKSILVSEAAEQHKQKLEKALQLFAKV